MRYNLLVLALALIIGCAIPACVVRGAADAADRDLPEPETFLDLAAREMKQFHEEYHAYALDWYRLGFDYAYPNYHITDADIWPRPSDKNRWRPRGSHFTYVITEATKDTFLIQAIGDDKKVAYEMRQNMTAPLKLP